MIFKNIVFIGALALTFITGSLQANAVNLVTNGDFSQGNTGFSTGYNYTTTNLWPEGSYAITTAPHSIHPNGVNTLTSNSSAANASVLIANGATVPNTTVWQQIVNVVANTNYTFSADITNWVSHSAYNAARLSFLVNGTQVGVFNVGAPGTSSYEAWLASEWQTFSTNWNSGSAQTATLSIVDVSTAAGGNDFALSNVSLEQSTPVPEPSSMILFLIGVGAMILFARKKHLANA